MSFRRRESKTMKYRCLTLLLALLLCFSFSARGEADDPVVVRVGEAAYPRSLVQFAYTSSSAAGRDGTVQRGS